MALIARAKCDYSRLHGRSKRPISTHRTEHQGDDREECRPAGPQERRHPARRWRDVRFYAARAENAELWDVEGRRFIDFAAGIAVLNTGHRHPKIVKAIADQLNNFTHTAYQIVPYASYVELAENQRPRAGRFPEEDRVLHDRRGSRRERDQDRACSDRPSGRHRVLGRLPRPHDDGHGADRQGRPVQAELRPVPGRRVPRPYPNAVHGVTTADSIKAIEMLFKADIDPKRVAAIIFEPVQAKAASTRRRPSSCAHCARSVTSTASC